MSKQYTIVLGKYYPGPNKEDWPTKENTSTIYVVDGIENLHNLMEKIIASAPAPWWWIFNGDITEESLILSGAIDPDDMEIVEELN